MKKKLLIHIGTHKTGSTAIQKVLFSNSTLLLENDIDYLPADCIWSTGHHALGWYMKDSLGPVKEYYKNEEGLDALDSYIKSILNSPASTVILSSETLFTTTNYGSLTKFKKALEDKFDIEVIIYLRHQSGFLFSWYSELVTASYGKTTSQFNSFIKNPQYPADYISVLDKWSDIFGEKHINVHSYEHESVDSNLIKNFFQRWFPKFEVTKLTMDNGYSHVSLAPEAIEELRSFNTHKHDEKERGRKIQELRKIKSHCMSPEIINTREAIYKKYFNSNELILDKYKIDLNVNYKKREKKKIILHIGTHKSGSTSIQSLMYPNADRLLANNIDYLKEHCIWGSAHHPLGWCMKNDYKNIDDTYKYDKSQGVIHSYVKAIRESTASTIVLSTETFFVTNDYAKLAAFYGLLCDDFDFEIVVYLRHQSAFLFSWYSELVTAWYGKITVPFPTFLDTPRYPTDYKIVLDKWSEIFGKDNMRVFSFEKSIANGGLLSHFMSNFIPEVDHNDLIIHKNFSRVSLQPSAIEAVRKFNALNITEEERQEKIKNLTGHETRVKSDDILKTQQNIYQKYEVVNEELKLAYGVDLNCWFNN